MRKITPQFMPHVERAPQFLDSVRRAKRRAEGRVTVVQTLDAFDNDPFLLYSCLWYAYSEGVAVTFLPA